VRQRVPLERRVLAALLLTACSTRPDTTPVPTEPVEPISAPVFPLVGEPATAKLPTLSIQTAGNLPIISKLVYQQATMALTDTGGATLFSGALEIRGRGNTTWELMPKKPYRLKLAATAPLLGMPSNRHWVLLANYSDKTLLRNDLALDLSRRIGMAWSARSQFVDVSINGAYDGIYQLIEHVRIAPDRVDITTLKATDTTDATVTGGYLLEVDERSGEAFCFHSTMTAMIWCVNDPETLRDAAWARQREYIVNYIARTDSALLGPRFKDPTVGYAAFIDVESAVNNYILQEVIKNVDGSLRFGPFFHKPRGGKLVFGPVWDFDLAFGNVNYDGADRTDGWHARGAIWYTRLMDDPAFKARVVARFADLKAAGTLDSLQRRVYARGSFLTVVQTRNFVRWPILSTYVWPNRVVTGSYGGELVAMHLWLQQRLRWVGENLAK
jgi:CotH kinase protein